MTRPNSIPAKATRGGRPKSSPIPPEALDLAVEDAVAGTEVSYGEVIGNLWQLDIRLARDKAMSTLYASGFSQPAIADAFGCTVNTVGIAIKRHQERMLASATG
jgi:DNA-binding NarL/FixJ family response regulator